MDSEKFAVIGAGFCGLGVMGAFRRHNIPFEALEADDQIGGNWYHGFYETVHIISSLKTTEYSDFPMPAGYPDFPTNLVGPAKVLRGTRQAHWVVPRLIYLEKLLFR